MKNYLATHQKISKYGEEVVRTTKIQAGNMHYAIEAYISTFGSLKKNKLISMQEVEVITNEETKEETYTLIGDAQTDFSMYVKKTMAEMTEEMKKSLSELVESEEVEGDSKEE